MWSRNREGGHLGIHLFVFIMEEDDNNDEDDESSRCPGNSWEWGGVGVSIEEVGGGGTIEGVGCRKINQADTELHCTATL